MGGIKKADGFFDAGFICIHLVKICLKDLVPRFQDPGFANLHRKTLEKVSEGNFNFAH